MRHTRTLALIADIAASGSVRRTAERLNLTPSALTRRIQDFEHELGTEIFERVPQGMRLNAAGGLVLRHIRDQIADLDRVRSQIADLSGVRRGHVAVACSQAFADHVLPDEVSRYRAQHPLVSFTVQVRDHSHAIAELAAFEADLALVLQPPPAPELQVMVASEQPLCALMAGDHPLAAETGPVRLRECLRFPLALPDRTLAIRHHLEAAVIRADLTWTLAVESGSLELLRNYVRREHAVSFQIPSGIPADRPDLRVRTVDRRDLLPVPIVLGHLRGRRLSVAAAKFADGLARRLHGPDPA